MKIVKIKNAIKIAKFSREQEKKSLNSKGETSGEKRSWEMTRTM